MKIDNLIREFKYNGVKLADPSPAFTVAQVRDFYSTVYAEIVSADIEGPEQLGNKAVYTFRRAVGTKGAAAGPVSLLRAMSNNLVAALQANWLVPGDAQFIKDIDETLRIVGPSAVSRDAMGRLFALHTEYCAPRAAC